MSSGEKKPFGGRDRRNFGPGGKRRFGKQSGGFGKKRFGEPRSESGDRDRPAGERPRGPRADGGFKKKNFRDRRGDDSPFRGMYSGPRGQSQGEQARPQRPFSRFRQERPERAPRNVASSSGATDRQKPAEDSAQERPHLAENELRYLGKNACLALWKQRPQDLVRVYVLREMADEFSDLIEYCAKNRKSYHLVGSGDLERLTDSIHHQGICMVARAKRFYREEQFFRDLGAHRTLVIYLDGVGNPHNLGAILRTAAHFGVKYVCLPQEALTKMSAALYRTAEGAAEFVNIVRVEDNEKFLDRLQGQGFHLYAFEPGAGAQSLFETRLNEKSVFVFGAEVEGLSGIVRTIVETKLKIPGTGAVESLNVSVAAAIAVAEFEKQGVQRSVRIVKPRS